MENSRIKNLQSGTPSFAPPHPTTNGPDFNPFPSKYQFCGKQRYLATPSPSCYPDIQYAASPTNLFWSTATQPTPHNVPTAASTNNAYTEPLQHLHTHNEQGKPFWHAAPSKKKLTPTLSNKSRRLAQRRRKRYLRMENNRKHNPQRLQLFLQHLSTRCQTDYGFCSNPNLSIQKRFNETIKSQPSPLYLQPKYLTFHNLCKNNKTPIGTRQLLGLNLKFCLSGSHTFNNINTTMLRMARSIRTHFYLKQQNSNSEENYDKQIYVKLKNWHPPPAPLEVENQITAFEKLLKDKRQKIIECSQKINLNNLTPTQQKILKNLKNNKNVIIKPTDKNLGPAAMDTEAYVEQVLQEHLLTNSYIQLTKEEAKHRTESLKLTFKNLFNTHKNTLSNSETTYFQRSLQVHCRLPIFYGLPKVHKNPISLRPVVSSCGSFMSILSTWLDFRFKSLLPLVKSYTKNSLSIINDLKHLEIPEHALLFSADAKSMYTNIDTNIGINSIRNFLTENSNAIPTNFPKDLFLQVLTLVMENNIFSFCSTYWLQTTGTAMGTPVACSYATVAYGQHENKSILMTFSPYLLYYQRYIDDIFGIWLPPITENDDAWERFKRELNNWGTLEWITENPSKQTTFLDLHLHLRGTTIITNTHQKDQPLPIHPTQVCTSTKLPKGIDCR
jgi:hypothetical protein